MQSYKIENVIDKVSKEKGLDKELLTSMSDFIFKETKSELIKMNNLSIYLNGFIIFFYGKKRLEGLKKKIEQILSGERKYYGYMFGDRSIEEVKLLLDKVNERLAQYEIYIEERKRVKSEFKKQKLENAKKTQELEECKKSSFDNA